MGFNSWFKGLRKKSGSHAILTQYNLQWNQQVKQQTSALQMSAK